MQIYRTDSTSLKQLDDLDNAFELMRDVEPMQPAEFILKGVVNAAYGQEHNSVCNGSDTRDLHASRCRSSGIT